MSALTDLFSGNFGNIAHDIFSDPIADIGIGLGAAGLGAIAIPELVGALPTLAGATDVAATAAPAVAADVGSSGSALALSEEVPAATAAGGIDPATAWINSLTGGAGGAGTGAGGTSDALGFMPFQGPVSNFPSPPGTPTMLTTGAQAGLSPATEASLTELPAAQPFPTPPQIFQPSPFPAGGVDPTMVGLGGGGGSPLMNAATAPGVTPGAGAGGPPIDIITTQGPRSVADTSNIFTNLGDQITKNPLSLVGVAGLGYNLLQGYQQNQALKGLQGTETALATSAQQAQQQTQAAAAPLLTSGEALQQAFVTGTLPPQYQSQVNQWVQGLKASIVSGYGARNMPTDPKQNSALAQDLANADAQGVTLSNQLLGQLQAAGQAMVQQANTMIAQGLSATQIAAEIPIAMQKLSIQLGQNTSTSIASFAGATSKFASAQNIALQPGTTLSVGA